MAVKLSSMLKKEFPDAIEAEIISEINYLDSGIPTLNYVISGRPLTGGIPLNGKIICMYGPEGSGKTSYVNQLIAQAQNKDYDIIYIDSESSITRPRLEQFGIDINRDNFNYLVPDCMEQVFDIIEKICKLKIKELDNNPLLIVWDSIAATGTSDEMNRTAYDKEIGSQSAVLTRGFRKIRPLLHRLKNCGCVFINQARENQAMFGDLFKMPGGKALQHECCVILRVNKIKPTELEQGIKISSTKNKLFNPFQNTVVQFEYSRGFTKENIIKSFCEFIKEIGILGQSGAWCYLQTDVIKLAKEENITEDEAKKKVNKFYLKDFIVRLSENEEYYQQMIKESEEFVNKNISLISNIMMDNDMNIEEEKEKEKLAEESI